MASLEGAYQQVADRLNGMDGRLNSMDGRLNSMDNRLTGIEKRIDALDQKVDLRADALYREIGAFRGSVASDFRDLRRDTNQRSMWVIGMIMTSWVTTILTVLFHR